MNDDQPVAKLGRMYACLSVLVAIISSGDAVGQSTGGLPPTGKASNSTSNQSTRLPRSANSAPSGEGRPQFLAVLGQQIRFTNPEGFCTPGNSAREQALVAASKQFLNKDVRLVHTAIPCDELEAYKQGQRDTLDHWMQIQLLGLQGQFERLQVPREAFLAELSKSSPAMGVAEIKRRISSDLAKSDIKMSEMNVHQIGRDGNAVYMSVRAKLSSGDKARRVAGLGGITLLNSLPLSVIAYEGTGKMQSRDSLPIILQQSLTSLLSEN
jgi:hypothetical protein